MKRRFVALALSALAACLLVALCGCTAPYDPKASMKSASIEADALATPGVLRVGVDAASYPFAGHANSRMSGFDVDVAAAIAQELGVKVEFVDVGIDRLEALADDEVDAVMSVERAAAKEGGNCWTSDAYAPSCIVVFAMDEGASMPKKDDNPVIAAQTSSLSAWLVTQQFGDSALQAEDDLRTVFQDLADGKVKYAAADAVVGSYVLSSMGADAHIVGTLQDADSYCIGVKENNTALQGALMQGLSTIEDNGVLKVIDQKWTGGAVEVPKGK